MWQNLQSKQDASCWQLQGQVSFESEYFISPKNDRFTKCRSVYASHVMISISKAHSRKQDCLLFTDEYQVINSICFESRKRDQNNQKRQQSNQTKTLIIFEISLPPFFLHYFQLLLQCLEKDLTAHSTTLPRTFKQMQVLVLVPIVSSYI